ncbi:patatin [Actinoplanes sp. SE50]|uniref:patatin-like phospholipase family protein n=1 Tax=unclassified Actinoplanes TaxID=2626549 RepID=UPI00023EC246|nr:MULTISPECIES: patatin-like phospholipase family protein [unclassified Actinoplanes]AEV83021.1 Lysophospholipase NTE1 [Actinoplanes sp. SE50/110]ATO81417.1 patatin [Actinoplanes sp. SE50]SLL98824.1 patatin [Actinoplanes sp. SE50/110]
MSVDEPIRIGLALGGGAVRGAAHIGVLDALDRAGLSPSVVTGTSAGALVGALYAAGRTPAEIASLAQTLRWARLVRPGRTRKALFETSKLGLFLDSSLASVDFADLKLPFAAVACELTTGREVVMTDGPVASAVLASAAIPGVFPPVERDGHLLVDGGMVTMVPAAAARRLGADLVIAVDVSGPLPRRPPTTLLHIMVAVSTLQPGGTDRLAEESDLVLCPEVDEYAFWELGRIPEFEQAGRVATERALPLLRALIEAWSARRAWERERNR